MRDRLINLIQNAVDGCARNWAEVIADHLTREEAKAALKENKEQ